MENYVEEINFCIAILIFICGILSLFAKLRMFMHLCEIGTCKNLQTILHGMTKIHMDRIIFVNHVGENLNKNPPDDL